MSVFVTSMDCRFGVNESIVIIELLRGYLEYCKSLRCEIGKSLLRCVDPLKEGYYTHLDFLKHV